MLLPSLSVPPRLVVKMIPETSVITYTTPVSWLFAPTWLTIEEAAVLSGQDVVTVLEWIRAGDVDIDDAGLIAKDSLHDQLESMLLIFQCLTQ